MTSHYGKALFDLTGTATAAPKTGHCYGALNAIHG